jgi:C_GCAxxG_C_C family probable redox protein
VSAFEGGRKMTGREQAEMAEEAGRLAAEYERKCTGCAQSVVAGLLDSLGIKEEGVFKAASGLADGIGLTRDGSCGALVGGCMVMGLIFGRERKDHQDMMKPMQSYLMCKELLEDFLEQYGTSRCNDIQLKLIGRTYDMYDPDQLQEAFQSDMIEHCSGVVERAARKAARIILREREEGSA